MTSACPTSTTHMAMANGQRIKKIEKSMCGGPPQINERLGSAGGVLHDSTIMISRRLLCWLVDFLASFNLVPQNRAAGHGCWLHPFFFNALWPNLRVCYFLALVLNACSGQASKEQQVYSEAVIHTHMRHTHNQCILIFCI